MRRIAILLVLVIGCGKSAKEQMKEELEKEAARRGPDPIEEKKPVKELPKTTGKDKPPPDPEPTTPVEIDNARKKAMIEGRDKDVVRFCEMGKVDDKSDPQVALGCTLSACRMMDGDKAKNFAKGVMKSKPLYDQAIKTCMANKVAL